MPTQLPRGLDKGERAALVISECQRGIVDPALAPFRGLAEQVVARDMLRRIADLAAACRGRGIPVVHCIVRLLPDARGFKVSSPLHAIMRRTPYLYANRAESEIHPALAPQGEDIVSERHHGVTGFHGTDLEPLLRGLGVETVVLAGVSTNIALIGMSIEAANRGFSVVIPEDCTAGGTAETHAHSVRHTLPVVASMTSSRDLLATWV